MPELKSVSRELPEVPYPADVRAGSFPFELDVERMTASDTWAITPADVRPWCLLAWTVSWSQTPAGSLPANEQVLAARLGCSRQFLAEQREYILRNWNLHNDKRLYHPVITDLVLKMLNRREQWKISRKRRKSENRGDDEHKSSTLTQRSVNVDATKNSVASTPSSSSSSSSSASAEEDRPRPRISSSGNGEVEGIPCDALGENRLSERAAKTEAEPKRKKSNRVTMPTWEDVEQVIERINDRSGRNHSLRNARGEHTAEAKLIRQRLGEWSLEDALRVVDQQAGLWIGDDDMEKYFRAKTIFAKANFEQYRSTLDMPKAAAAWQSTPEELEKEREREETRKRLEAWNAQRRKEKAEEDERRKIEIRELVAQRKAQLEAEAKAGAMR